MFNRSTKFCTEMKKSIFAALMGICLIAGTSVIAQTPQEAPAPKTPPTAEQIARLLQLGLAAFSYFAVTLLCAGCKAVRDGRPAAERQLEMPPVVGQFEICAGVFAACQAVALGLPGLRGGADFAAMVSFAAGFGLLTNYFIRPGAPGGSGEEQP